MGGMSVMAFEEDDDLDFDVDEVYSSFEPELLYEIERLDSLQGEQEAK
jgi:hypothetical protein